MAKKKPDTAGKAEVWWEKPDTAGKPEVWWEEQWRKEMMVEAWDEQTWLDAPLYINEDLKNRVVAADTGPANYGGLRQFVSDMVKLANVSDEKLKPEDRARLRRYGEILLAVVADVEKILANKEGQSDHVRKIRLETKFWQFGGLIFEIASYRGGRSIAIHNRIRSLIANEEKKTKSQTWHAIAFKLATPFWRDYPAGKPTTIARAIERQLNEELAALGWCKTLKTETIADYVRDDEDQIKSTG
jgi:hypothetical protein